MSRGVSSAPTGKKKKEKKNGERKKTQHPRHPLPFTTGETIVQRDNQVLNSWRQPAARCTSGVVELVCQGNASLYTCGRPLSRCIDARLIQITNDDDVIPRV